MGYQNFQQIAEARQGGEAIDPDLHRIYEREHHLIRVAIETPLAFAMSGVMPQMFLAPDHQKAWRVIGTLSANGLELNAQTLHIEMNEPRSVLWVEEVTTCPPVTIDYALKVLVPELQRRHKLKLWSMRLHPILEIARGGKSDPTETYALLRSEMHRTMTEPYGTSTALSLGSMKWDPKAMVADLVPLGEPKLDIASGGGHGRGELMVVGSGTHVGKSWCAQKLLRYQAMGGRKCLCICVEDSKDLMFCRAVADFSNGRLPPVSIRQGIADPEYVDDAIAAMQAELGDRALIVEAKKATVSEVCDLIRMHRYLENIDMVLIDYLQAVRPDVTGNNPNRAQETADIVSRLKKCFAECRVAGVVFSQFARDEYRENKEPDINAFKWSGSIEEEAEIVVILWRDKDDRLHAKLPKIKWTKARHMRFVIHTDPHTGAFGEWEDDFEPPEETPSGKKYNRSAN